MTWRAAGGLDHVVVNAMRAMEPAAAIFAGLGFQLTPLGRHSLGSINHLMMTPGAYLELVGVPHEGKQRQEVLESPSGLSGLVFATRDADREAARLRAAGLEPSEPVAFSRPVEVDGETREARFRTVRVPGRLFPAGRVYVCEHLTPELVWREEWLSHPNGLCGIDRIEVGSTAPDEDAARYATAAGVAAEGRRVSLDGFTIDLVADDRARFRSLGLRFETLAVIREKALALPGAEWSGSADGVALLEIPEFGLRIECRAA